MRVLLTGAEGQLGRHLAPRLAARFALVTSSRSGGDVACDLADAAALHQLLDTVRPQLIVNSAAWTNVDGAEDHPEQAGRMNHRLPGQLAEWCQAQDALLVHFSTDYVFSGEPGRPWNEADRPAPTSVYGQTKWAGEQAIRRSGARALILRTAWLYSALPGNFLSAILARAARGESLRVVSDQLGSPTWAGSLARMTLALLEAVRIEPGQALTLHAANRGLMSWHALAELAVELAHARGVLDLPVPVEAIASGQWPQKARRPSWSALDMSALEDWLGEPVPTVQQALSHCLDEWSIPAC